MNLKRMLDVYTNYQPNMVHHTLLTCSLVTEGIWLTTSGCRTSLNDNWTGDWEQDCFRTGNLAYVTLNLPRIAYNSRDDNDVFDYLDTNMHLGEEVLMLRREQAMNCLDNYNLLPFLTQEAEGDRYYRINNATLSFGFVGLNEMLISHCGEGIENPDARKFGLKVIKHMNKRTAELTEETGLRWSVLQTPAESTAYRFGMLDKEKYGDKAVLQGDDAASYYTNSSHVPVNSDVLLPEKIKIEEKFHPLTLGGHIFHAFMGESYSDPDSLMSLTNKIANNSDIGFWAYSSALSFCIKCKTLMKGLQTKCGTCGEETEVEWYDRITGYVQQVRNRIRIRRLESRKNEGINGQKEVLIPLKLFFLFYYKFFLFNSVSFTQ